jgi:thiol-disulfide isomerase/thioredoxin
MIKKIISLAMLFLILGVTAKAQKNRVTIHGTIKGDLEGHNKMYFYTRMGTDSSLIENGKYSLTFTFNEPEMKHLLPEYILKGRKMYRPLGILIAEPGDYYINSDTEKGMNEAEIKGPKSLMLYLDFDKKQEKARIKINKTLADFYGQNWYQINEENPRFEAFKASRDSLETLNLIPLLQELVQKNPDSYVTGYILASNRGTGTLEQKDALFAKLSPRMKKQGQGKKYGDYIQGLRSAGIGKMVSNFVLPNPSDKVFSFASLKGNYVLIDFWASWCAPCRASFPRMREVYNQYKNNNFTIYSISIDENKADWLKAVKEEANPWPQTLDTKNISQSGFAVTAVPTTFLIDPTGKIIMTEIGFDPKGGSEIEKKIIELFGDKLSVKKEENPSETKAIRMMWMNE